MYWIELLAAGSLKEVYMHYEHRCSGGNNVSLCPSFNWNWAEVMVRATCFFACVRVSSLTLSRSLALSLAAALALAPQAAPWYQRTDALGKQVTVNAVEPGGVAMGAAFIFLVAALALRCKHLQEITARQLFVQRQRLLSQHASVEALLKQYIPARFGDAGPTELLKEEFPAVTILFCSFDTQSVREFVRSKGAHAFLTTVSSIVVEFDLLLESTDLFKLENVGSDYIVTSSVVKWGISKSHPDTHARRVKDAVKLVQIAQKMLMMAIEFAQTDYNLGGGEELDFKVGMHTGPCVGAVAGEQRRFYRLFGDTINTAARMCSHSTLGYVQLSEVTHDLLQDTQVQAELRGRIKVKGKGDMNTYQVTEAGSLRCNRFSFSASLRHLHISVESPQPGSDADKSVNGDGDGDREDQGVEDAMLERSQAVALAISTAACAAAEPPDTEGEDVVDGSMIATDFIRSLFDRRIGRSSESNGPRLPDDVRSVMSAKGQYRAWSGEFAHSDTEADYLADRSRLLEREQRLLLSALWLSTLFMHAYTFQQSAHYQHNGCRVCILVIGGVACAAQAALLWCMHREYAFLPEPQALFWAAFGLSSLLLVPLVFVVPMRYPVMGLMLVTTHFPSCSSARVGVLSLLLATALVFVVPALGMAGDMEEGWLGALVLLAFVHAVVLVMRRSFFMSARNLWQGWQVEVELSTSRRKLAGLLYDLVPNMSACNFVLKQHEQLHSLSSKDTLVSRNDLVWVAPFGDSACVLAMDLVNFTPLSQKISAMGVVHLLHDLWCIMDRILAVARQAGRRYSVNQLYEESANSFSVSRRVSASRMFHSFEATTASAYDVKMVYPFKVDTVGDAYVIAIVLDRPDAAEESLSVSRMMSLAQSIALELIRYSNSAPHGTNPGEVQMRMGMCLGPAVSGLMGLMKPRYHLVGDALHTASELESKSAAFHVLMDDATCSALPSLNGNKLVDLSEPNCWQPKLEAKTSDRLY
eukprot:CAMPEP_0114249234 /NCGR_PEP_ID=MMETSP0058-20121206/14030_1 /TAXON_ID=36894 /ORGANISM="Pyramimonas parkeae, CCMP726" /LENGTH=981 /DNA_ID=CAMNT_0001362759 /DNA_START=617 /DNA_END=3562 /DNA_ORIENTATION=-